MIAIHFMRYNFSRVQKTLRVTPAMELAFSDHIWSLHGSRSSGKQIPMISPRVFHTIILVWFFGWGFLLLKFPVRCYRIMSWGKTPNAKQVKRAIFVGYMGVFFGCLFLCELALGLVHWAN
jgi:hypothetical protein